MIWLPASIFCFHSFKTLVIAVKWLVWVVWWGCVNKLTPVVGDVFLCLSLRIIQHFRSFLCFHCQMSNLIVWFHWRKPVSVSGDWDGSASETLYGVLKLRQRRMVRNRHFSINQCHWILKTIISYIIYQVQSLKSTVLHWFLVWKNTEQRTQERT
jgi:hypothetical protein